MALYRLQRSCDVEAPVLVVGMEGWIDAGYGGGAAMAAVLGAISTELLASFDDDALIDYRARRPLMRIVDGVNSHLEWPQIQLRVGHDAGGRGVLALVGPEPDMRWHAFTEAVVGLAAELHVRMVVGLGAFPAPVPHTRPLRLVSTATSAELAAKVGFVPGTIDVPAGVLGALERGFAEAGIPAVGLWARVPHYVAGSPYPAASAALLEGLKVVAGIEVDNTELNSAAAVTHARIQDLMANSDEHTAMVGQLEQQADAEASAVELGGMALASGDEIAAELERFLRGEL
jgi:predicted ATP-grasp superfamily ATP-dependent carboligase